MSKRQQTAQSRSRRTRAATALAMVGALVMSMGMVLLTSTPAQAAIQKVWVCKYSHTPEIGEEAQTVISVDYNENRQVGTWGFEDEQVSSYVYGVSVGDGAVEKPDTADDCPPYNPPGDLVISPPGAPTPVDPCGPGNIAFPAQSDTTELDWTLLQNGDLTVAPQPGYDFSGGSQLITFPLPADSGVLCTQTIDPPAQPGTTDPCGPNNIAFEQRTDTAQLDWTLLQNGNLTVAPIAPYVFSGQSQLITFILPADSNVPCIETITPPAAPETTDPCNPTGVTSNIAYVLPADTASLNWEPGSNGSVTVAPQAGYQFSGGSQLITFDLPADSGEQCVLGVQEIVPAVSFQDPTCAKPNRMTWSGEFTDIVDYTVSGTPGRGQSVTVDAAIKPSMADDYKFVDGVDTSFQHTFGTLKGLNCVKGSETIVPKPDKKPVVLGTQAGVPTAVAAGIGGGSSAGSTSQIMAQLLVAGGMLLLMAGGWIGLGRRESGAHEA